MTRKRTGGASRRRHTGDAPKSRKRVASEASSVRDLVTEKYRDAVVFDPAAWQQQKKERAAALVWRENQGAVVAYAMEPATTTPLNQPPPPIADAVTMLNTPWACDPADDKTLARLATLAESTVGELCYRRNAFGPTDTYRKQHCPEIVPPTRRRCLYCPKWALTEGTPY